MALSTIHPESPTMESSKDMMTYIFARLQLKYTIQQLEVKEIDGDEAKVEVLQVTQKLSGNAAFRDNRVKMLHTMKRDGKNGKCTVPKLCLLNTSNIKVLHLFQGFNSKYIHAGFHDC